MELLLLLFLLHFVIDFLPALTHWSRIRQREHRGFRWLVHAGIQGLTAAVAVVIVTHSSLFALSAGCAILFSHWLINLARSYVSADNFAALAVGQALHVAVVFLVGITPRGEEWVLKELASLYSPHVLAVVLAYVLVLQPVSVVVRTFLAPWILQIKDKDASLAEAGTVIGYLERILILTFIFAGEYMAIGVVLALKAAYRFKDTSEHSKAEYLLMGTFLSLLLTLFIGIGAKFIIEAH